MADPSPVLVFDFDGTLIESAPELRRSLNLVLDAHGRPALALDRVELMIGDGVAKLVERGFEATGGPPDDLDAAIGRFVELYHDAPIDETPLYDGVPEVLETLNRAGYRMAICTNKVYRATIEILDGLGLSRYFESVAGGDSFPVRKPDPGHLLGVLDTIGVAPRQAIMIGDSPNDIDCARAVSMRSIAVTYGYSRVPHADLGADLLIDRFDALPDAILRLSKEAS